MDCDSIVGTSSLLTKIAQTAPNTLIPIFVHKSVLASKISVKSESNLNAPDNQHCLNKRKNDSHANNIPKIG
jgi:hypothetical protein